MLKRKSCVRIQKLSLLTLNFMDKDEAAKELQETLTKLKENGWAVNIMPQYSFEIAPCVHHKKGGANKK